MTVSSTAKINQCLTHLAKYKKTNYFKPALSNTQKTQTSAD